MRQKYEKAGVVYNINIHITGNIGALLTGTASGGVNVDAGSDVTQIFHANTGMVAGHNIENNPAAFVGAIPLQALLDMVKGELERVSVSSNQ